MLQDVVDMIFFGSVLTPQEREGMEYVCQRPMTSARNLLGLSVRTAAERYGVNPTRLNRIERNMTPDSAGVAVMMEEDLRQVFLGEADEQIEDGGSAEPVLDPGDPGGEADVPVS